MELNSLMLQTGRLRFQEEKGLVQSQSQWLGGASNPGLLAPRAEFASVVF